jgi:hypothetical protein
MEQEGKVNPKHILNFLFLATLVIALAQVAESVSAPLQFATEIPALTK